MDFNKAILVVGDTLKKIGTEIDSNQYDGIAVKKLSATNTIVDKGSSKQTHIAITGEQMDFFPYLRSDGYFNSINSDLSLKNYYVLEIPIILSKSNIEYLGESTIEFTDHLRKSTFTCIERSKRKDNSEQVQLSILSKDGEDFIKFRKMLYKNYYLILLKRKNKFLYEAYGIKDIEQLSSDFTDLNGKFIKLKSKTTIPLAAFSNLFAGNEFIKRKNTLQEIHFGAPGTGKSYSLAGIISESYKGYKHTDENPYVFRTTIYSEYTYYDFIGNIMPSSDEDNKIEYKFSPGVFTQALTSAFKNEDKDIYLIIEEMSRGNIASILGDIFQLLDRDSTGKSEYCINNDIIYKELISKGVQNLPKGKIYLPSNFHILGTVNTSDQNVNVIDTAFKRRFDFVYEQVKPKQEKDQNGNWVYLNSYTFKLGEETFEWNQFYQKVNEFIVNENNGLGLSEDKQLGQFFVKFIQQSDNISNEEINNNNFKMVKNKILHYLWDDVQLASMTDNRIFNENLNSFADLYDIFDKQTSPKEIFSTEFLTFYNTAI
ncbi:AAA family ATPase [Streptococcus equinus]|uniref:AAA family ATPase n=1 Tax=Streptococcus equinus TaxID=1335 RepID=UPI0008F22CE9|nr:AAA family ATPase [Streptococcus equinus]SFQ64098.1 AAA domain (dynein-related subfamily) [Streptococcus equinus]